MNKILSLAVVCCILLIYGCSTMQVTLPPVTEEPTGRYLPGKFVWHDLLSDDIDAAKLFYGELFGWQFEPVPSGFGTGGAYTLIRNNGQLIAGLIDATKLETRADIAQWVSVLSVSDVDVATGQVEAAGGTVFTPATNLGARGRISVVADPQGAVLALLKTQGGDPVDREPGIGDFLWHEIWTDDTVGATQFYMGLAGFVELARIIDGAEYRYLSGSGEPRAGVRKNPLEGLTPIWVPFIRVADPGPITEKVEALGGRVILEPQVNAIGGKLAVIADPSGAGLVIQSWTPPETI